LLLLTYFSETPVLSCFEQEPRFELNRSSSEGSALEVAQSVNLFDASLNRFYRFTMDILEGVLSFEDVDVLVVQ
jgi:hypothetical protein